MTAQDCIELAKDHGVWLAVGFMGQAMFSARFLIQWLASEKSRNPLSRTCFGGFPSQVDQFCWFTPLRQDPVFIVGQAAGLFIYSRNIFLIYKNITPDQETNLPSETWPKQSWTLLTPVRLCLQRFVLAWCWPLYTPVHFSSWRNTLRHGCMGNAPIRKLDSPDPQRRSLSSQTPILFWLINILWSIVGVSQGAAMVVLYLGSFVFLMVTARLSTRLFPTKTKPH